MRKEGLKKDGAKNGIAEDQDADGSMGNAEENLDSSNGNDAAETDPLDGTDQTSNVDASSVASEKRSKTKGAKKAIHDAAEVKPAEETNGGSDTEDGGYEVEEITDHKIERKKLLFLVRWKNFPPSDDTWEPESSLSCPDIIAAYREAHPEAVLAAAPAKGRKRKSDSSSAAAGDKKDAPAEKKSNGKKAEEEEEYEVEDIVDHKIERKRNVFLIRWKGYEADQDTWEKESGLTCPEIVEKYKAAHAGKLAEDIVSKPKKTPEEKKAAKQARASKEYEVQRIVGSKTHKGKLMYQVRWKGYSIAECTWEAEDSLNCPELIADFIEKEKSKRPKLPSRSPKKKTYGEVNSDVEDSEDEKIPAKKQRGNAVAKKEQDEDYEVEKIVDDKMEKHKKYYLVKWKGWPASNNTWQDVSSLACPDLLKKYEEAKKATAAASKTPKKTAKSPAQKVVVSPKKAPATPARKAPKGRESAVVTSPKKTPKAVATPKKTPKSAAKTKSSKAAKAKPAATSTKSGRRKSKAVVDEDDEDDEVAEADADDQEWEVEDVTDVKYDDKGTRQFLIRWKGCDSSQDTWEPESNLECHALIKKFLNKADDSDAKAPKKKKARKA